MGELLLLTAIAWAAAKGIETTIDEVKGRSTPRHKRTAAKVAKDGAKASKGPESKDRPTPAGVPATFGRKAATVTARTVAPGASWGRDAITAYRESIRDAYRAEAKRARKRRAAAEAKKQAAEKDPAPTEKAPTVPAPRAPTKEMRPAPDTPPGPPRLRVLPGGSANATTDPGSDLMTILESGEIRSLDQLIRYLRAVSSVSQINYDCARLLAEQDAQLAARLDAMVADLAEYGVDSDTIGEVAALREQVEALAGASRAGADAALAASEAATTAHTGAQERHGGIADAAAESDVPVADAAYYTPEGK